MTWNKKFKNSTQGLKFFDMYMYILLRIFPCCTFSVDFPATYQDWNATDPLDLFEAPTRKSESNPKVLYYLFCVFHQFWLYSALI